VAKMRFSNRLVNIFLIIICFASFELLFREVAPLLSGNIKQIYAIPDIANEFTKKNNSVLFLGNSLIGNAINLNSFDNQANLNMPSYKVVPDATSLWDWTCIIKNNFINKERLPQVVVLGYAWDHEEPVPSRLGSFFCNMSDLPNLINMGMNRSSSIFEFLLSKLSRFYAMRETIRKRILDTLVPNYRTYTRAINNERNKNTRVKHTNIKPEDVVMPITYDYDLDEQFFSTITENGGTVLDYRKLDAIDDSMFRDPIHLNQRGNKVFTSHLANDLNGI